jgi:lipopolysaccharide export system permease protein
MRVLDRYIVKTVTAAVALVAGVLLVLVGLFLFIGEQADVGTGQYGSLQALGFVAMNLPEQLFEFLPVAAMIGGLLGLGTLARSSELTVMRASGISILRIGGSVAIAGLLLTAVAVFVGEYLAPDLSQQAREQKAFARFSNLSFAGQGGVWVRDGNLIVKAEQHSGRGEFGGLLVFDLTDANQLRRVGRAVSAVALPGRAWELGAYAETAFEADRVVARSAGQERLQTVVSAEFLAVAASDPGRLSVRALAGIRAYLAANGQDTRRYDFALWSRVARMASILFAVLLALPFVFGSLRASGAGARATLGLVLGIAYFVLQKMVESGTVALRLDPLLLAWVPPVLLSLVVCGLTLRLAARS